MLEKKGAKSITTTKIMKYSTFKNIKKNILFHTMLYYDIPFFQARAIFFHINSTLYLNTHLIRMLSCFYHSCRNILCGIYSNLLQQKYFELCTALCVHTHGLKIQFSTNKNLYTPFYPIDWGSHRKTLGISASRGGRRQG